MISSSRKNGTAKVTGSCISGGSTSGETRESRSTSAPPGQSLRRLAEAQHVVAPRGPQGRGPGRRPRCPACRSPAWRGPRRGTAATPDPPPEPAGSPVDGEVQPPGPHPLRHRLARLEPAQLERRVLGAGDADCPTRRAIRWRVRRRAAAAAASAWPSRTGRGTPARRRDAPRRTRSTASGSRCRAPRPCRGSCRGPGRRRRICASLGSCRPGCSAAISANIALIACGVIGISGDFMNRNSAASCLLVPMISGTGCVRPSRASFDRVVGYHVAVDDRRERQRARVCAPGTSSKTSLGRGEDRVDRHGGQAVRRRRRRRRAPRGNARRRRRARPRRRSTSPASSARSPRENSPAAAGLASSVVTMPAPADSPNSVTRPGSPPNAGDVVAHPLQREQHVAQAEVGVERGVAPNDDRSRKPSAPSR